MYFQISSQLAEAVERGDLVPGERLPNEIALAESLDVSRPTMRQALDHLVEKGMVTRKRGVGTQVNNAPLRRRVALTSLHDDLTAAGRTPETRVLRFDAQCFDRHAARMLGVPPDQSLVFCERLRLADGQPLALLRNWLPQRFSNITHDDLAEGSLYQLLGQRNARPAVARQRISAQAATATTAKLLNTRPRAALISMRRTAFDDAGQPVELGDHLYRADSYAIDVTVHSS